MGPFHGRKTVKKKKKKKRKRNEKIRERCDTLARNKRVVSLDSSRKINKETSVAQKLKRSRKKFHEKKNGEKNP